MAFEFPTVDRRGEVVSRNARSAPVWSEDLGGGDPLEMVSLPTGGFLMGSPGSIGYADEHIECFLARDLTYRGESLDEGEFLETLRLPFTEALEWVRNGKIRDSKTMLGLLWFDRMLNGGC